MCSLRKTSRIYPCPTIIRFILTRKNLQDLYHWLFQTTCKLLENCTHYSSRYLYGPYMAVPPHPARRVFPAFIHMLITKIITVNGLNPGCTFFSGFLFTTAKVVFITAMIIFHYSSPRSSLYDFHIFISSSSKKTLWPIPRGRGGDDSAYESGGDASLHSKHFRASSSRKLGREQKKKGMIGEEEGSETLAHKPHDFEKLRSPTNAAFDWCGAGSVD